CPHLSKPACHPRSPVQKIPESTFCSCEAHTLHLRLGCELRSPRCNHCPRYLPRSPGRFGQASRGCDKRFPICLRGEGSSCSADQIDTGAPEATDSSKESDGRCYPVRSPPTL